MSDSNVLSTSDAFTSTHKLAVEVLIAAWTIRPEGEDIDDIADLLGVYLERAADEEIAKGLAEVACVPHDQMRGQLRVAAQQELHRRAFPSYRWATTTEIHPVRYRSSLHMAAHLLDAHLEQVPQRLPLAQLEDFHAEAHRHWQGRPHRHTPAPSTPATAAEVHVLVVATKHDRMVTVHWTDEDARAALASFVDQAWEPMLADEPMPADPGAAIERYFSRTPRRLLLPPEHHHLQPDSAVRSCPLTSDATTSAAKPATRPARPT